MNDNTSSSTAHASGHPGLLDVLRDQPRQVWVTAFAAVIAFMGIGLVDPILNTIAESLGATPSQTTLLFASYLGVQVVAMLFTGVMSYRFGAKRVLVAGLLFIIAGSGLCALAGSITELVWLRAVWGLGNAFFITTALSVIVEVASGGQKGAVLLYEAALGLGLAVGPLVGAALGHMSWRAPFAGTAVLMVISAILCLTMLRHDKDKSKRTPVRIIHTLHALGDKRLLLTSLGSAFYTMAFFIVIAWAPFLLGKGAYFIGLVFFGWGVCVAISGVFIAPRVSALLGERPTLIGTVLLYAAVMLLIASGSVEAIVVGVIVSGLLSGVLNTLFTDTAMRSKRMPRSVCSAGYNFCRWTGGALAAILVGHVAAWAGNMSAPFWAAAVCCLVAVAFLACLPSRRALAAQPA